MNAVNSVQTSAAQGSEEPSMEEILASIRRIIADDSSLPRVVAGAHEAASDDRAPIREANLRHRGASAPSEPPPPTGILHQHPPSPVDRPHDDALEQEALEDEALEDEAREDEALQDEALQDQRPQAEVSFGESLDNGPVHNEPLDNEPAIRALPKAHLPPDSASQDEDEDEVWREAELSHRPDLLSDSHGAVSAHQFPTSEGPMSHPIPPVFPHHEERLERLSFGPADAARRAASDVEAAALGAGSSLHEPPLEEGIVAPERGEPAHLGSARSEPLLSAAADSAVAAAFNTLAASRLVDQSETLMELTRELLRPMVQAWVEQHLPSMVERFVVAEIERIAGKRH